VTNLLPLLVDHLKNIKGWSSRRKLIILSIDDYCNVRLDSKASRKVMAYGLIKSTSRFDCYDALETREDLEMLYDVLSSVKSGNSQFAVFTPFVVCANLDFVKMKGEDYKGYQLEELPESFNKMSVYYPKAYQGTWSLWKEGVRSGLMQPEFHGREHFNLKFFVRLLKERNHELMIAIEHRSLACLPGHDAPPGGWTASFGFWDIDEDTKEFSEIIRSGLACFREVFGYDATVFTAPAQQFPVSMEKDLAGFGLKAFDRPFYQARHLGGGKFRRQITFTGYDKAKDLVYLVRNVVFEPTSSNIDHVAKAMQQIEAAFRWNRPAIISSHRVNFCGHIDPANRAKGLGDLRELLKKIVEKWPDVEFMSAGELSDLIRASHGVA
jgi:hypothetical protein